MFIEQTYIADLLVIEPKIWKDGRGYFFESFNKSLFKKNNLNYDWVQDNEAFSSYGVIRGLHFQKGDAAQAKLVRVIQGEVLDVAVDLRLDSSTFGKSYAIKLTDRNKRQLLIPRGFAHGYAVLSEYATFAYKCDNVYNPAEEDGIIYNDIELGIDWKIPNAKAIISEKDLKLPTLEEFKQRN